MFIAVDADEEAEHEVHVLHRAGNFFARNRWETILKSNASQYQRPADSAGRWYSEQQSVQSA
jgi:hypothetical protein